MIVLQIELVPGLIHPGSIVKPGKSVVVSINLKFVIGQFDGSDVEKLLPSKIIFTVPYKEIGNVNTV